MISLIYGLVEKPLKAVIASDRRERGNRQLIGSHFERLPGRLWLLVPRGIPMGH